MRNELTLAIYLDRTVPAAVMLVALLMAAALSSRLLAGPAQSPPPALRTSVDLVTIDVQVVPAKAATTIRALTAADFEVTIGGHKRVHRQKDRRTAHYVIGVDRTDADKKQVKDVRVKVSDKTLLAQTYQWRSPIR